MLKKAIRELYLKKRLNLSETDWVYQSLRIVSNFKTVRLEPGMYLLSYSTLRDRKEFDIDACVSIVKSVCPHIKIGWPRIEPDMLTMEAYQVTEDGLFAKNKFNILEPVTGEMISPESIDAAFVPLVAFDRRGYRVGYGKGYYDRYLKRCRADLIKIGFSFFDPIDHIKDINDFDVPLDLCITPSRIYEF